MSDQGLKDQIVRRQRFSVEVIWATTAEHDAFDDEMTELLGSIVENGEMVLWRYDAGPVEILTPTGVDVLGEGRA